MPVVINQFEAVAEPAQSTEATQDQDTEQAPRQPLPPDSVALALALLEERAQRLWAH